MKVFRKRIKQHKDILNQKPDFASYFKALQYYEDPHLSEYKAQKWERAIQSPSTSLLQRYNNTGEFEYLIQLLKKGTEHPEKMLQLIQEWQQYYLRWVEMPQLIEAIYDWTAQQQFPRQWVQWITQKKVGDYQKKFEQWLLSMQFSWEDKERLKWGLFGYNRLEEATLHTLGQLLIGNKLTAYTKTWIAEILVRSNTPHIEILYKYFERYLLHYSFDLEDTTFGYALYYVLKYPQKNISTNSTNLLEKIGILNWWSPSNLAPTNESAKNKIKAHFQQLLRLQQLRHWPYDFKEYLTGYAKTMRLEAIPLLKKLFLQQKITASVFLEAFGEAGHNSKENGLIYWLEKNCYPKDETASISLKWAYTKCVGKIMNTIGLRDSRALYSSPAHIKRIQKYLQLALLDTKSILLLLEEYGFIPAAIPSKQILETLMNNTQIQHPHDLIIYILHYVGVAFRPTQNTYKGLFKTFRDNSKGQFAPILFLNKQENSASQLDIIIERKAFYTIELLTNEIDYTKAQAITNHALFTADSPAYFVQLSDHRQQPFFIFGTPRQIAWLKAHFAFF